MATELRKLTFSTDEQVVVQGNVNFVRKMVESLVVEFYQAKYEESLLWLQEPQSDAAIP